MTAPMMPVYSVLARGRFRIVVGSQTLSPFSSAALLGPAGSVATDTHYECNRGYLAQLIMLNAYTFNGFIPRPTSMVAAGAKRNDVRDKESAHPNGSTADNYSGTAVGSRYGTMPDNNSTFNPEKGRRPIMESNYWTSGCNTMRDFTLPPSKVLLRSPEGDVVINLLDETMNNEVKRTTKGQFTTGVE